MSFVVKESGVVFFEYLEIDGYVKGFVFVFFVEFFWEGINFKLCLLFERILKCL